MNQANNDLQYLLNIEELYNLQTKFHPVSEAKSTLVNFRHVHEAAARGDIEYIKNHLDCINRRDEDGETPLFSAAVMGQYETCKFLIDSGCWKHIINYYGLSAYHLAYDEGHYDVADLIGWNWFF